MATLDKCVVFLCVICAMNTTGVDTSQFPLNNCPSGQLDMLIITDYMWQEGCDVPLQVATLVDDIKGMLQSPTDQSRQGLRFNLITYSSPNLQTVVYHQHGYVSSHNNNSACELDNYTSTYVGQPRESKMFLIVDFIYSYFSERLQDTSQTDNVAILIIAGPQPGAVEDINKIQRDRFYETDIRLFVIMTDFSQYAEVISHIPNTLYLTSIANMANSHLLLMFLCGKCKQNWVVSNQKHSRNMISCYYIDVDEGRFKDWFGGIRRCEMFGSSLASIETRDEQEFLERHVVETIIGSKDLHQEVGIFIGLRRDPGNLTKRFHWLSGNPLITSQWAEGSPRGDYLQSCAVWTFHARLVNLSNSGIQEGDVSLDEISSNNGWVDVQCLVPVAYISLCEVVLQIPNISDQKWLKMRSATPSAIHNAIMKGEFVEYNGSVMSIAANAGNTKFYSSLPPAVGGFELFLSDEYWYNGKLLSYSQLCDGVRDYTFGGDESLCFSRSCHPQYEFQCRSGQCVPMDFRCDVYNDCLDHSDESHCTECKQKQGCDGICVPKNWQTETSSDFCPIHNLSIHDQTRSSNGEFCAFICNRTSCVYPSQIGDGVLDCSGPEGPLDQYLGQLEKVKTCGEESADLRWAPRCVYIKDQYNGILGCRDMSHLWNCENFTCPEGYVKCPSSYCIPLHLVHDGHRDCPLGEDEAYLNNYKCLGLFACASSLVCLHPDLVCDGSPQCPSGDDELNCHTTCARGFKCVAGTVSATDYDKTLPLTSLTFVDSRTRFLDLSGLSISKAVIGTSVTHLGNLITLRFSDCELTTVDDMFSSGIWNLQSVYQFDLSYNFLQKISRNSVFRYMSNLRILSLSYNEKLAVLEDKAFLAFNGRSLLETLSLDNTAISILRSSVLQGLNNLKVLNLSNTLITALYNSFPKDFKLQIIDFRETAILIYNNYSFNGLRINKHMYTDNFGLCCPEVRGEGISEEVCHAPVDTISSCTHLVRERVQRVLLWLVGFLATVGNVTVIISRLVCHRGVIKKSYGVFVTNLGVSDLIMGLYLLLIASADVYFTGNYVLNGRIWKQGVLCQTAGFLSTLSYETSAFFIMLVTLDRYLVMKFPFGQCHFSKQAVLAATCLAWCVGFTLAVIPLLPTLDTWRVYSSNSMCLGLPLNSDKMDGWRYSVSVFVVLNSIIFLAIVVGQLSIYRAMSENRAASSVAPNSKRRAQDVTVAKQLSLVVLADFLCWFPIGLLGMLAVTGHELSSNVYTWTAVLVLPVNSALNPLLYTVPVLFDKCRQFVADHTKSAPTGDNCLKQEALQQAVVKIICVENTGP